MPPLRLGTDPDWGEEVPSLLPDGPHPGRGVNGVPDLVRVPWRVGRRVGRTVYAVVGLDPSDDDILIGVMDTRALASAVVRAHNRAIGLDPLLLERPEEG